MRVPPPNTALTTPCDAPEAHLRGNDWEVIAGRLGVALIQCSQAKDALAAWVTDLVDVIDR